MLLQLKPACRLQMHLSRAYFNLISSTGVQGDLKQIESARLRSIPILYGTPNFPIIIIQTLNYFSNLNQRVGYKYIWAGLNPTCLHW